MPKVSKTLRSYELAANVDLTTSYANGDYTITDPGVAVLRSLHVTGTIAAGATLTVELWDSTLDRQYMPATACTTVAGATGGVSSAVILVDCVIPRAAALKLKAKLGSGTGVLSTATLTLES